MALKPSDTYSLNELQRTELNKSIQGKADQYLLSLSHCASLEAKTLRFVETTDKKEWRLKVEKRLSQVINDTAGGEDNAHFYQQEDLFIRALESIDHFIQQHQKNELKSPAFFHYRDYFSHFIYQTLIKSFTQHNDKKILALFSSFEKYIGPTQLTDLKREQPFFFFHTALKAIEGLDKTQTNQKSSLIDTGILAGLLTPENYHMGLVFLNNKELYTAATQHNQTLISSVSIENCIEAAVPYISLDYALFLAQKHRFDLRELLNNTEKPFLLYAQTMAQNNANMLSYLGAHKRLKYFEKGPKKALAEQGALTWLQEHNNIAHLTSSPEFLAWKKTQEIFLEKMLELKAPVSQLQDKQLKGKPLKNYMEGSDIFGDNQVEKTVENIQIYLAPFLHNVQTGGFMSDPFSATNSQTYLHCATLALCAYIHKNKSYQFADIEKALELYFEKNSDRYDYTLKDIVFTVVQQEQLNRTVPLPIVPVKNFGNAVHKDHPFKL